MVILKKADRSATLSFCPSGPFLAAGSVAGAIDLSFSTSSVLEIFRLDFTRTDHDLRLAGGAVQAPERFSRVCWGPPGVDTKTYPYGLIAGGLADGSVCVWNPARIIGQAPQDKPVSPAASRGQLLARLQKHQGAVKGLEFNGFSPNLLASGGADGELCIWDVGNPMQPSLYPAMKGGATAGPQPEITYLSWNRKVQHILGTCTAAGSVVVWDLKKQRPVISFKDPSGRKRCSSLQWNPEVATQLMVASDDDLAPSLQLWDLRNSVSPIREFHGHTKGVLGMSWCPQDSTFLLSSGKDNRTICWDVNSGEMYCELPPGSNWNFDVQWAPGQLAGVFATATFEGQVALSSLTACTAATAGDSDGFSIGQAAPVPHKAPSWMRRPCGASFGFGGKLVQFANSKRQLATGETATTGTVTISQVLSEPELVSRSEAFEAAIRGGDREALNQLCQEREQQLAGSEEAESWAFLQTHFAADGRKYLLERLGFADFLPAEPEPSQPAEEATGGVEGEASAAGGANGVDGAAAGMQQLGLDGTAAGGAEGADVAAAAAQKLLEDDGADFFSRSPEVDASAFFENLSTTPQAPMSPAKDASVPASPRPGTAAAAIVDGPPGEAEPEIQKLLFVGNYAGAVDACMEAKRHADAMVIASVVGGELWDTARKAYMTAHPRPFMRLLHSVLSGDWAAFIKARPAAAWRETLAAILTSAPYDQFEGLLATLAGRLASAGMGHAATLCYICGGDVDAAVRQWSKAAAKDGQQPSVDALESLLEKAVVLGIGVNKQSGSGALSDLIARYAELLAANGRLATALEYLGMIPGEPTTAVAVLQERIYQSAAGSSQLPPGVPPPPFPFAAEDVTAAPAAYQQQTAAAPYGQQQQQTGYGQQAASAYQSYGGGYGQQAAPQQNGYGGATAASYGGSDYGSTAAAAAGGQQYSAYGSGYGMQQAAAAVPAPPTTYQPMAGQAGYGGGVSPTGPPPAPTPTAPPPMQQQPAVFQPTAAPPAATAPPTAVYQPAAAPPVAQPPSYAPTAAPSATPTVYQHTAAPTAAMVAPPTAPAPPQAPPPQVYQPAAAPQVYQQAPGAGPAAAAGPGGGVYQPSGSRAASLSSASGALPSPTFVPQQGPAAAVPPSGMPLTSAKSGPTPTPITAPPPPPPSAPSNINLSNADTSSVAPHLQPIVASLTNLYRMCEAAAGAHPGKRREVEDSSKKLGALFWKMNKGEISDSVATKLLQLCQALDAGDFVTATHLQVSLTTSDWDECAAWLTALKRLIKARQTMVMG